MTAHQTLIVEQVDLKQTNAVAPSSADPLVAGEIAQMREEPTSDTKFNSLDELKKKAPKVYNKMLEGMAMTICNEMQHRQDEIKKKRRESERH